MSVLNASPFPLTDIFESVAHKECPGQSQNTHTHKTQERKSSTAIEFLSPVGWGKGGGEKVLKGPGKKKSGYPGNLAGIPWTPGLVQKACAQKHVPYFRVLLLTFFVCHFKWKFLFAP